MTIFDLLTADAIAAYWTETNSNRVPYLGEVLFPAKKMIGLNLAWIKGFKDLPVALMPSAFDAKPTIRSRGSISKVETEMPFFRESMRLGEKDRQRILEYLNNPNSPYARAIIEKLYDDSNTLIEGALVIPEIMRMSLLFNGEVTLAAPDSSGQVVNYTYKYADENWIENNTEALTLTDKWDDATNCNPVQDMIDIQEEMRNRYGVEIKRAVMNSVTFGLLAGSKKVRDALAPIQGIAVGITDTDVKNYIFRKTGITISVYDKRYYDYNKNAQKYVPDNKVAFLPDTTLGSTWFGTTPEEADVMAGVPDCSVSIVGTGVAVTSKKTYEPVVNLMTVVSEIVLPSFERMGDVFVLTVK
jgi:hypothetical protein